MANQKLQLEVEVDSSGAIRGLNVVQQSIRNVAKESQQLGTNSGFEKFPDLVKNFISNPLDAAGTAAKNLLTTLGPVGTGITAVGSGLIAFTAVGYSAAKSLGELGDQIGDTSIRMGLTVKEVNEFRFAMKFAGGDIASLEGTMRKLSQGLNDGSEEGKKSRDTMRELGISTRTLTGETKPISDIILQLADAFGKITDPAKRNATAIQILGRSALEALPDLLELNEGVKRARELGLGPTEADLNRWQEYQRKITEADAIWEQFKRKLKDPIAATIVFTYKFFTQKPGAGGAGAGVPFGPGGPGGEFDVLPGNLDRSELIVPKAPRADPAVVSQFKRQVDDLQRSSADAAKGLGATVSKSLEGAQSQLERLKQKYDEARNKAQALSDAGEVLPDVAQKAAAEVNAARLAYQQQEDSVKQLSKLEANRLATLEKARDLLREGQGFLKIGSGLLTTFVSTQEIEKANQVQKTPSLTGRTGNPSIVRQGVTNFENPLPEGLNPQSGTFVSPESSRIELAGLAEQQKAFGEGLLKSAQERSEFALTALRLETDATERLIELRTAPGAELTAARVLAGVRQSAIEEEFRMTGEISRYREQSLQNEIGLRTRIAEIDRQHFDDIQRQTQGILHTLFTNPAASPRQAFTAIRDAALKPIEEGLSNRITATIKPVIFGEDGAGGINKFLGGLVGAKANDPWKVATDANTRATIDNTAALKAFALNGGSTRAGAFASLPGPAGISSFLRGLIGPGGTSGFAGPVQLGRPAVESVIRFDTEGSGFGPSSAVLPTVDTLASSIATAVPKFLAGPSSAPLPVSIVSSGTFDQLGLPVSSDPFAFSPFVINSTPKRFNAFGRGVASLAGGGNVFKAITGDDFSIQGPGGVTTTASSQGLTSTSGRLGTLVGAAGAILGGVEGVLAGVKTGGARGAFGAVGSAAGAAALLDPEPISKAILAGIAVASELATKVFGDPKKQRQEAIENELRGAYAPAPASQSFTTDTYGNAIDYNNTGQVRSVNNHYTIQAMDAASFHDYLHKNGRSVASVVDTQMESHGPLQQRVRSVANPA